MGPYPCRHNGAVYLRTVARRTDVGRDTVIAQPVQYGQIRPIGTVVRRGTAWLFMINACSMALYMPLTRPNVAVQWWTVWNGVD